MFLRMSLWMCAASLSLAAVACTLCSRPDSALTPMCAFMPKGRWLPFFAWCIAGSRAWSFILVRRECTDDGGVFQRAFAHEQPALAYVHVDLLNDSLRELLVFQQAAQLQQLGGVGHLLARQVDDHQLTHGLAVVDGIFQALIA